MKAYTDLEQSKKLAEILPLESADMYWQSNLNSSDRQYLLDMGEEEYFDIEMNFEHCGIGDYDIPAWSLAALLNIIPYAIHKSDNEFYRLGIDKGYNDYAVWYTNNGLTINDLDVTSDNFVDACVEMIIKLHEQNLL